MPGDDHGGPQRCGRGECKDDRRGDPWLLHSYNKLFMECDAVDLKCVAGCPRPVRYRVGHVRNNSFTCATPGNFM